MSDLIAGRWNQLHEPIKMWWNKLSDTDLDEINGNYDILISKLLEKYGYTTQQAEDEVKQRLNEFDKEQSATVR